MTDERKRKFNKFLEYLSDSLDIPENMYVEAEARYKAVGDWLRKEGSPLVLFEPDIYPQGSFRLGTVVKPISDADEYDIDLVCELKGSKETVTQKQLKNMVGNRLKENKTYARMLDKEGKRCWTLNYADGASFHMDILPAIPDDIKFKKQLQVIGIPDKWTKVAICITDKTNQNYALYTTDWPRSNPKGYAEWFKERMKIQYEARKKFLAEEMRANIEDVPEYRVKTPLQRTIQILKRHRDIMFENDQDYKPISIIITTLAARAYDNEADLFETVNKIIVDMPHHIQRVNGVTWVQNPVNPDENFADKWGGNPELEKAFTRWLTRIQSDISAAFMKGDIHQISEALKLSFGAGPTQKAFFLLSGNRFEMSNKSPAIKIQNPSKPWRP
jgi:hypothetical protein